MLSGIRHYDGPGDVPGCSERKALINSDTMEIQTKSKYSLNSLGVCTEA